MALFRSILETALVEMVGGLEALVAEGVCLRRMVLREPS